MPGVGQDPIASGKSYTYDFTVVDSDAGTHWYHSTGSWNTTLWNYKNAEMDRILEAARAARTEAEQKALYVKFQALALEDPPGVVPYVINHINAYRKNVKGFQPTFIGKPKFDGVFFA